MNEVLTDLKNILKFFLFPVLIFAFSWVFLFLGLYDYFPWFDIPIHVAGGIAVGFTYFFILKYFQDKKAIKLNPFFNTLFVISLVALTTVLWEFYEFLLGLFTPIFTQPSLEDTLLDFFMGLSGGLFAIIFLESYFKSK